MGAGRDSFVKTVVNRDNVPPDPINPGPAYMTIKPLGSEKPAFKLKFKIDYEDPARMALKKNIPGAGTYNEVLKFDP